MYKQLLLKLIYNHSLYHEKSKVDPQGQPRNGSIIVMSHHYERFWCLPGWCQPPSLQKVYAWFCRRQTQ